VAVLILKSQFYGVFFNDHGQCDTILTKDKTFVNGLGLELQIRRTKLIGTPPSVSAMTFSIVNVFLIRAKRLSPQEIPLLF
jgi:hypothetical protein